ncbi:PdaC/SigV domain-containing protein [Erythrobacter sp. R86502]|uniref:PdaC/SigV domain-containing protein n=1 Tax=Erythrobacter sp. R86502 TaxID=3093846 RepID=UPI0036D2854D
MRIAMFHVEHRSGVAGMIQQVHAGSVAAIVLLLGAMLAGCAEPEPVPREMQAAQQADTPEPPMPPAPAAPDATKVTFSDNASQGEAKREFGYAWPAEVSAVPLLAKQFTAERDKLLAEQKADWTEAIAEYGNSDCIACVNRGFGKTWEVVADLPRFLSLSASFYAYTGGAHGNSAHDALVWDREKNAAIKPAAMFRSPAALQDALGAAWCKALKAQRTKRLGEEYSDDGFFPCPPIADLTVLVGSSDKQAFDRIGLIAAPYVAGSYAEGDYEVTMPVNAAVLAAVKPEYKAAFALGT